MNVVEIEQAIAAFDESVERIKNGTITAFKDDSKSATLAQTAG